MRQQETLTLGVSRVREGERGLGAAADNDKIGQMRQVHSGAAGDAARHRACQTALLGLASANNLEPNRGKTRILSGRDSQDHSTQRLPNTIRPRTQSPQSN